MFVRVCKYQYSLDNRSKSSFSLYAMMGGMFFIVSSFMIAYCYVVLMWHVFSSLHDEILMPTVIYFRFLCYLVPLRTVCWFRAVWSCSCLTCLGNHPCTKSTCEFYIQSNSVIGGLTLFSQFNSYFYAFCSRAYVFFSSPVNKELVAHIKKDTSVLPRIGGLSEVELNSFTHSTSSTSSS